MPFVLAIVGSGEALMPEAPDLEIIKDFLNQRVSGQPVESATVMRPTVLRSPDGDFSKPGPRPGWPFLRSLTRALQGPSHQGDDRDHNEPLHQLISVAYVMGILM